MLSKAELGHVDRLHHIGRQLAVLKRLYQGYDLLIDRLLEKREVTLASLKNSNVLQSGIGSMTSSHVHVAESQSSLGVSLSSAARVRFESMKHRIQLYALSEVEECLNQKESLVMMVCTSSRSSFDPILYKQLINFRISILSPSKIHTLLSV
jgi:hypothetical protein